MPIKIAEDPLSTVVLGSGRALDNLNILKEVMVDLRQLDLRPNLRYRTPLDPGPGSPAVFLRPFPEPEALTGPEEGGGAGRFH